MLKKILSFLFFFFSLNIQAQNKKVIDSLMTVYQTASYDTTKILALADIAFEYYSSNPDTCISLSLKTLEQSKVIGFKKGMAESSYHIGLGYIIKGDYNASLKYLKQNIKFAEEMKDSYRMGASLNVVGIIYKRQSNYPLALEYFKKSLKIAEERGVIGQIASTLNNIGVIYEGQGNYPLALEIYQKSLKIKEEIGDKTGIANSLNNIALIYESQGNYSLALETYQKGLKIREEIGNKENIASNLGNIGNIYNIQENYPLALEYHKKSLKIKEEIGEEKSIAISLNNIGVVYSDMKDYPLALEFYQKSLKIKEEIGDKKGSTYTLNGLALVAQKQGEYEKSILYGERGLKIAQDIGGLPEVSLLSNMLFETYKLKGDYEKALEYHELYTKSNDSLFSVEKSKAIANLESTLEIERKEKEIGILNKDKELDKEKQAVLQKDLQLQSLEVERQKSAKLIIEKQAEADQLFALAKEAQSEKKADSLYRAAQNAQLEADNLKITAQKVEAEQRATEAENEQKIAFQRNLSLLFGIGILAALIIAYVAYRNQRNKQKANLLLAEKNDEINHQNDLLAKSNQTKDKLFSIIAHDLRSPIASFQGINDQISFFLQKNKPERLLQMSDSIDSSARNLNHLLNNLLNWALTQTNQISIQKKEINLFENIEEALKVYQMNALIHQVELKNTVLKDVVVYVDKDSFQTILRNLIGNAIKYTPENGKITVSAQPQKDKVLLSVTDTGIGINEEDKQKLFELGVGNTNRGIRGEKGTGLGLVLCYEFAALNKIGINVESQPNEGTAFNLSIPTKS